MEYGKYKNARNASWQCIIDYNIKDLPVKVSRIINKANNIELVADSEIHILSEKDSGLTICRNGIFTVVYKDSEPSYRCRFTIAHELGHIFLGHLIEDKKKYRSFAITDETESEANVFARDLLSPACVLHELGITSAQAISNLCNISWQSAVIRAERMQLLEQRNAWYKHPLERQVLSNFKNYIENYTAV